MTKTHQQALGVFGVALTFYATLSYLLALGVGHSVGELSVFYDGHLYLSIARSFPLPYSERALDYAGHAPGLPALAWVIHDLTPSSLVNWGEAMMAATWIPAAAAVALFFLVALKLEANPWLPTLFFGLANPSWILSATTPHAEPLAIALLLGALLAQLHSRAAMAGLLLALAVVTRFPSAVLGAWLFLALLAASQWRPHLRIVNAFGSLAAFGLLTLYLDWRIPSFEGISQSHAVFWNTGLIVPFSGLIGGIGSTMWTHPMYEITYSIFFVYVAAMAAALWSRDRQSLELGLWIVLTAGAAASFRGLLGLWDYPRLSIPAWPAALLVLARFSREVRSRLALAAACCVLLVGALTGVWSLLGDGHGPYKSQPETFLWLEREMRSLDRDSPRWVDFRRFQLYPGLPVHEPK